MFYCVVKFWFVLWCDNHSWHYINGVWETSRFFIFFKHGRKMKPHKSADDENYKYMLCLYRLNLKVSFHMENIASIAILFFFLNTECNLGGIRDSWADWDPSAILQGNTFPSHFCRRVNTGKERHWKARKGYRIALSVLQAQSDLSTVWLPHSAVTVTFCSNWYQLLPSHI